MNISKEAKVGILATVAIATLYFGYNFLKGSDTFSRNTDYVAVFDQVGSLQSSNFVKLNGVQVGKVKSTQILPERGNKVLVIFEVNNKIPLYAGTKAMLSSALLGGSELQLTIPNSGKKLSPNDTVVAVMERTLQDLVQEKASLIQEKTLPIIEHSDTLVLRLNRKMIQLDKSISLMNQVLSSMNRVTMSVGDISEQNKANIALIMSNLTATSQSLIETEKSFKPVIANLKTATDSLKALKMSQALDEAKATIASIQKSLKSVEAGNGTAGKLLKDEALYENLNRTVVSLNKLMTNFREEPKRYVNFSVFGRKDKGPKESPLDTLTK